MSNTQAFACFCAFIAVVCLMGLYSYSRQNNTESLSIATSTPVVVATSTPVITRPSLKVECEALAKECDDIGGSPDWNYDNKFVCWDIVDLYE